MDTQAKKYEICEECFKYIAQKSTTSARVWFDICEFCHDKGPFIAYSAIEGAFVDPHLKILEREGYIYTCEIFDGALGIKVLGIELNDFGIHFCPRKECKCKEYEY